MRTVKTSNYIGLEDKDGEIIPGRIEPLVRDFNNDLLTLFTALQRRISFGDGTDGYSENIDGEFQVITTNATPDTEDAIAHTLGSVPVGYLIVKQDKAGSIYTGTTSWTSTNIYLRSDVASVTATIFLLK